MIAAFEILGGRHDGAGFVRSRYPAPFLWVDAGLRCWARPGRDREMHRLVETRRATSSSMPVYRYQHAHFEAVECAGCGWTTPRETGSCILCGSVLS